MSEDIQEKIQSLTEQNKENHKIIIELEEEIDKKIKKIMQKPKRVDRILNPHRSEIFIDSTDSIRIFLYNNYSDEELLSLDKLLEIIDFIGVNRQKVHLGIQPNRLLLKIQLYD